MPYITQRDRDSFNDTLAEAYDALGGTDWSAGAVNYLITKILYAWWMQCPCYARGNDIMGVLSCVSKEVYRRVLVPYEDLKRDLNGDVFDE